MNGGEAKLLASFFFLDTICPRGFHKPQDKRLKSKEVVYVRTQ